jgi:O-acetyl-ADP-ribose deacetylase (regulator of RNase III)
MIRYTQGNLLDAPEEALVNTVNEVGVMGKGIARMFREAFPESAAEYEQAARRKEVRVGRVLVTRNEGLLGPRWIVHFPTKRHWRNPSRLEWVREGLADLVRVVREREIRSIAVPPLGCGHGGLDWRSVRAEIEDALGVLDGVDVVVFEPTAEYQAAPKRSGVEVLTPARALVVELVRRYSVLGLGCTNLEVQKLAWFLQRSLDRVGLGSSLSLQFSANRYGPYADQLRHLLDRLDGSYLHCHKRLSDAGPSEPIWVDESRRDAVEAYLKSPDAASFVPALDATAKLIDGFESPFGMELLATVDWLLAREGWSPTLEGLQAGLASWPGGPRAAQRKQRLFGDRVLALGLERLTSSGAELSREP